MIYDSGLRGKVARVHAIPPSEPRALEGAGPERVQAAELHSFASSSGTEMSAMLIP